MSTGSMTVAALLSALLRDLSATGKTYVGDRSFLVGAQVVDADAQTIDLIILGVRYRITITDERDLL